MSGERAPAPSVSHVPIRGTPAAQRTRSAAGPSVGRTAHESDEPDTRLAVPPLALVHSGRGVRHSSREES
ncbi:hypothetical protein SGM_5965 [Streptomyces griseoaurantiacus M045]|uniref:Uncharacterized protein n=1 Tax=Streptomyces griseoaurantiacus M045 TaxID=996637 RepID=F3NS51_9ACTN|nr:hypothetical protein SGM_5965 [Streptomyces griseoaurantiacus M045]